RRALFARCPPRALPAYPAFHADHRRTGAARSAQDRRPTTPRRRSPSATSVPEPAARAAELGRSVAARAEVGSACPCASGCPRSVGRKRATRGAMPATVSLITHPPKRHTHPAAQHRSTRDREHYGETSLPGVVATDLDTEHGGTDANQRDGARQLGRLNVDDLQL